MNKTEEKIKAELKAISFMPDAKEIRKYYLEDCNILNFRPLQEICINNDLRLYNFHPSLTLKQLSFIISYLNDNNINSAIKN